MKKSLLILGIAAASLFTYSCKKDEKTEETPNACDTNYTYEADIATIISSNCTGCHSGAQPPNLTTYSSISASITSIKNAVVVNKTMPKNSSLSQSDIDKISCWIEQGHPEN